jgi:hypothetical protein
MFKTSSGIKIGDGSEKFPHHPPDKQWHWLNAGFTNDAGLDHLSYEFSLMKWNAVYK